MTEPAWMTEAIRMIQEHGNQRDPIERARMEYAIYQHLKAQRDAVLEEAAKCAEEYGNFGTVSAIRALKQP